MNILESWNRDLEGRWIRDSEGLHLQKAPEVGTTGKNGNENIMKKNDVKMKLH